MDVGGTLFFIGLAAFFFFVYGRTRRCSQSWEGRDFSRAPKR